MTRVDELLDRITRCNFLTMLDLCKGYWQIPLDPDSFPKPAFITLFGLYQFRVMPFRIKNAPATFQRMVDQLLDGLPDYACAYLDDIMIYSDTWEDKCKKLIEVDDERKLRTFYEKRMATEVSADPLGDEWKGYVVCISGGNDKQGFPMKQGVLTHGRVRLLLSKGHSCYRPRRTGERKRKSVHGCILDANLSVLNLVIVRKGDKDILGLTDNTVPRRLGPKRASRIHKLFNLSKEDDVRQYVVRKPLSKEKKKPRTKAPKIQHLVTLRVLQHKRRRIAPKKQRTQKNKEQASDYAKLLAKRTKEAKEKHQEQIAKRCRLSSLRASTSKSEYSQK
ncbi:40S ribosomal protein S6-like [Bombina bombina]|uniref:40S ribosomal protein S6-like n=1 Tax=Bombina bombina TaxID=8345 RepID=UPI00235AD2B8|nr:40S ribosomal protein S6-like [Bombina bombina]